jgi:hypothetical protein
MACWDRGVLSEVADSPVDRGDLASVGAGQGQRRLTTEPKNENSANFLIGPQKHQPRHEIFIG